MPDGERVLRPSAAQAYYDRFGRKQDSQGFYEDPALDDLIAHASLRDAQSVFEFGCGTGKLAARLLAQRLSSAASYRGCDISPVMVGRAPPAGGVWRAGAGDVIRRHRPLSVPRSIGRSRYLHLRPGSPLRSRHRALFRRGAPRSHAGRPGLSREPYGRRQPAVADRVVSLDGRIPCESSPRWRMPADPPGLFRGSSRVGGRAPEGGYPVRGAVGGVGLGRGRHGQQRPAADRATRRSVASTSFVSFVVRSLCVVCG